MMSQISKVLFFVAIPLPLAIATSILMPVGLMSVILMSGGESIAADQVSVSYLDQLRALEKETIEVIKEAKKAFVFINGGSGFCISADGYVLTNDHVVKEERPSGVPDAKRVINVYFTGGRMYRARIIGRDTHGDIALLKLEEGRDLPFLELGDSSKLTVGQRAIALGDPFLIASENLFLQRVPPDYEPSASMGIISAIHRYSDSYSDAIQVDMAVNRGNSGGPLITYEGRVVGINGKIETRFALGINTGVGYAIPSNQIKRFLDPLKKAEGGRVRHGIIQGMSVAERAEDKIGLPVLRVIDNSAADKAGFKEGDILLKIQGLEARTRTRYLGILSTYPAGDEVKIHVSRAGKRVELAAVLVTPGRASLGVTSQTGEGDDVGAKVVRVRRRSAADRAGIKVGDLIVGFEGEKVTSTTDLARLIRKHSAGDEVKMKIKRDGKALEIKARLGTTRR